MQRGELGRRGGGGNSVLFINTSLTFVFHFFFFPFSFWIENLIVILKLKRAKAIDS